MNTQKVIYLFYCVEAFFFICLSKTIIFLVPSRIYFNYFGKKGTNLLTVEYLSPEIAIISKSIEIASKYNIFKIKCFEKAIAGRIMLYRRGISSTIYLGLKKEENRLYAHAWLKSGEYFVTGKIEQEGFISVVNFTA